MAITDNLTRTSSRMLVHAAAVAGAVPRTVHDKLGEVVSVLDVGAVGDGVTDDSAAIQAALNSGLAVTFPPAVYYCSTALTVPATCPAIHGHGATITGPGKTSDVDGFVFLDRNSTDEEIDTQAPARYHLPSVEHFRYGVVNINASWIYLHCDIIRQCHAGLYLEAQYNKYLVECDYRVGMIQKCDTGIMMVSPTPPNPVQGGIQGCRFYVHYIAGCSVGIGGVFGADVGICFNEFHIVVMDGNGSSVGTANTHAIKYNRAPAGPNLYRIPVGPISCDADPPFVNVEKSSVLELLYFRGMDPTMFAFGNFLARGPVPVVEPGNGTLYIYVHAGVGSDEGGNGSVPAPFGTIPHALNYVKSMDLRGNTAVIMLAPATYDIGLNYDLDAGPNPNAHVILRGAVDGNPSSVIVRGGINASGANARLAVENLTVNTAGIVASNNAVVSFSGVVFGAMPGGIHLLAKSGGAISAAGAYSISGEAIAHASGEGGTVRLDGAAVSLVGSPAFSTAFAYAALFGLVSAVNTSFSGAATGPRFTAILNSVINTSGAGPNLFPGSSAGGTASGGQYA